MKLRLSGSFPLVRKALSISLIVTNAEFAYAQNSVEPSDLQTCSAIKTVAAKSVHESGDIAGAGLSGSLFGIKDFEAFPNDVDDYLAPYIRRLSDTLKSKGTELIVVIVPPRAASMSQYLPLSQNMVPGYDAVKIRSEYSNYIKQVNNLGIFSPDILKISSATPNTQLFFLRDHHWSTAAVRLTARAVADYIKKSPAYSKIPSVTFLPGQKLVESKGIYAQNFEKVCSSSVPAEKYVSILSTPKDEVALLDANEPEIVLVGTSNSSRNAGKEQSFSSELQNLLQRDVANEAQNGGGFQWALETYLLSNAFHKHPAKFLIWEIESSKLGLNFDYLYQQMIPTIKGTCKSPTTQAKVTGQTAKFAFPKNFVFVPGDYIQIKMSNLGVTNFNAEFSLSNGKSPVSEFERLNITANTGIFYVEIPKSSTGVSASFTAPIIGTISFGICQGRN